MVRGHAEIDVDIRPGYPVSWQAGICNGLLRGTMRPISAVLLRTTAGLRLACRLGALGERMPSSRPGHVSIEPFEGGSLHGEWVRGATEPDDSRIVLYFHGGGYFFCSPATHRAITWRFSAAGGCPLLAVAYRQGPVHGLPESLADAVEAYRWLLDQGYAGRDIVLAGDSAGGHLTLATLLTLRDRGLPLPRAAICLSPWTDLSDERRTVNRWRDPMLPVGRIEWLARRWTDGLDPRDPLVSPVYGDYTGVPPLMIVVGSTEVLRDEAHRVALRAREAGVPVTYEEWTRMPHVFPILADLVPEARLVFRHINRFLSAVGTAPAGAGDIAAA
jgi:acetyl esterase/lipase